MDHLWCSNISNSFTPDQGMVGHKYIKSFVWWHLQMTVISSDIHEWSGTPYTTCNCSSRWPLKLTELHTFPDWMLNFIKTVSSHSRWPSTFLSNTERKLIISSHITFRMVECIYPFSGDTIYQPEGYWINHMCAIPWERKSYGSYCSSTQDIPMQ